jgi:hypothetical protein
MEKQVFEKSSAVILRQNYPVENSSNCNFRTPTTGKI